MNILGNVLIWFVSLLGSFLAVLPHSMFLVFVKILGFFMCLFDNNRRYKDAMNNLNFIYGESLSIAQKRGIIKRCYRNFAFVILESIRVVKIPYHIYSQRFELINEHYLTDTLEKCQGAIAISGHFGYWEAMATFLPPRYRDYKMASLGRLTGIKSIDSLIISRRESQGVKFINKSGAFKHLLRLYSAKNPFAGILVDQNISQKQGEVIDFMGKKATHTTIASVLSRRFNMGIVPIFIDFNEDYSRYFVYFYPPIFTKHTQYSKQDIKEATQLQADITSKVIYKHPSSWFWFHRRWKSFYKNIYA